MYPSLYIWLSLILIEPYKILINHLKSFKLLTLEGSQILTQIYMFVSGQVMFSPVIFLTTPLEPIYSILWNLYEGNHTFGAKLGPRNRWADHPSASKVFAGRTHAFEDNLPPYKGWREEEIANNLKTKAKRKREPREAVRMRCGGWQVNRAFASISLVTQLVNNPPAVRET